MLKGTRSDIKVLAIAATVAVVACAGGIVLNSYLVLHLHRQLFTKEYGLTLTTYDGKAVRLADFRTQTIVAYAWASWCPYCGAEIENLAKLKKTYGDKIQIIAVNRAEPVLVAKAYTDQLSSVSGVVFLTDPKDTFFKMIDGYAMPETVFIKPGGDIEFHQRGPMQFNEVSKELQQLIGQ